VSAAALAKGSQIGHKKHKKSQKEKREDKSKSVAISSALFVTFCVFRLRSLHLFCPVGLFVSS
jgi:hypothetical protein